MPMIEGEYQRFFEIRETPVTDFNYSREGIKRGVTVKEGIFNKILQRSLLPAQKIGDLIEGRDDIIYIGILKNPNGTSHILGVELDVKHTGPHTRKVTYAIMDESSKKEVYNAIVKEHGFNKEIFLMSSND